MGFIKPGPNKRVCALLIDWIVAQVLGGIASLLSTANVGGIVLYAAILFRDSFSAQSVGKYLVGIQVLDENGLPAKPSKGIIRNILMIIPFVPIIEYVKMLRDKEEGKRFGDILAKTKVNDLKPQMNDSIFLKLSLVIMIVGFILTFAINYMYVSQHPELLKH